MNARRGGDVMVEVTLPYGESNLRAELPDRARVVGRDGGQTGLPPALDQAVAVREALEQPLGLPRIRKLVRPNSRVLIAFDDLMIQSVGPVRRLAIEFILAELAEAGVPDENVHLVCANALHRKWTHTPDGMSQSVRDNRMHVVLDEMGQHLESKLGQPIFKVETLLANPATIGRVLAGGVRDTRAAAMEVQASLYPPRRSEAPEKADIVVYGVPAWSGYATFASLNPILTLISTGLGYVGGYIQAAGKPGCSVIMATPCPEQWDMEHHPAYKEVWDRVLPETRDPYEISERFMDDFAARKEYIEKYRFGYAYHPVHAKLAVHPLKRLRHAGRVFVAGSWSKR